MISKWGFLNSGYVAPKVSVIKEELTEDFIHLFGNDVDLTPGSPNNMLINMIAERYVSFGRVLSMMYQQTNIDTAGGAYLDRFAANVGLYRIKGGYATGSITFYLLDGVIPENISYVIPKGTLVHTQSDPALYFETQRDAYINMASTGGYITELHSVDGDSIRQLTDQFGTYYQFDLYADNYVYDIQSLALTESNTVSFTNIYDTIVKQSNLIDGVDNKIQFTVVNSDIITEIKELYVNGNIRTDYETTITQIQGLGTQIILTFNADTPVINDSIMIEYMESSYTVDPANRRKITVKYRPPVSTSAYTLDVDRVYDMFLVYKSCSATVPIKAVEMSYLYNVNDNMIVIPEGINLAAIGCTNEYATTGGYDTEPDSILRIRVKNSYKGLGAATKAALEYRLKNIDGVTDAVIIDPYTEEAAPVTGVTTTNNSYLKQTEFKYTLTTNDIDNDNQTLTITMPDYIEDAQDIGSAVIPSQNGSVTLTDKALQSDRIHVKYALPSSAQSGNTIIVTYNKTTFTKNIVLKSSDIINNVVTLYMDQPVSSIISLTCNHTQEGHTITGTIDTADPRKIIFTDTLAIAGDVIQVIYKQLESVECVRTNIPNNIHKIIEITTTNSGVDTVYNTNLACEITKFVENNTTKHRITFARIINGINVPVTNVTSFKYNIGHVGQFKTYIISGGSNETHNAVVNCIENYRPLGVQSIGIGDGDAYGNIIEYNEDTGLNTVVKEYPFSYFYKPVDKQISYVMYIKWIDSSLTESEINSLYNSITTAVQNYLTTLPFNTVIYKDKLRIIASDILLNYAQSITIQSWSIGTEGNMSQIVGDSYIIPIGERLTTVDTELTTYVSE